MKKLYVVCLALFFSSLIMSGQSSENIVILWDVTGSLLPHESGVKDNYTHKLLPVNKDGNGMWNDLKAAVIECIDYSKNDPMSKITVVTFQDSIRLLRTASATDDGKKELVKFVKEYTYKRHSTTNIVDPIRKFYNLLEHDMKNYMFLFTDGDNDNEETLPHFKSTLESWTDTTNGYNAYGFYVLVHPDADKMDVRKAVEPQDNFWIVPNAKVRIKICDLPKYIKYNLRDQKDPMQISVGGEYGEVSSMVIFVAEDEYYDVSCPDSKLNDGKISIEVAPKSGVVPPVIHTLTIKPSLPDADEYTFVGPDNITLKVVNKPERSLNLVIDSDNFGKASYYDEFPGVPSKSTLAKAKLGVDFSDEAKMEGSSVVMKVYLVDRKGQNKVSPVSQGVRLYINGKETDHVSLTSDMTDVTLSLCGGAETDSDKYYGIIELVQPSGLDNCKINGTFEQFRWHFSYKYRTNPLLLGIIWFVILSISSLLLWMIFFRPIFFPRFGSIQKVFNVPGMPPLIVKFKGARMIVISSTPQKKQSALNKIFKGPVIYKVHPAFASPLTMRPVRGGRILVKADGGKYRISPNPMPRIGSASIDVNNTNIHITIN